MLKTMESSLAGEWKRGREEKKQGTGNRQWI